MNAVLHTKFGIAKLQSNGYYHITSYKEGNYGKRLHRLIWESIWGKIPKNWVIHHVDGNKTNNCILNLWGMDKTYHNKLHNTGKNNPSNRHNNRNIRTNENHSRKMLRPKNTRTPIRNQIRQPCFQRISLLHR